MPPHIEETVRAVEQLHSEHQQRATPLERLLDRLKARVSAPIFVAGATLLIIAWVAVNLLLGHFAWDAPPFPYLELFVSALALLVTILILATQRRADRLAAHREQLILQLAFVSEQKAAKVISLLEELRRDSPELRDRIDPVAEQMTESVNPRAVSEALRSTVERESSKIAG